MKKPLKIWFDAKGNMLDQGNERWYKGNSNYKVEEAKDFKDRLEFKEITIYYPRVWLVSAKSGRSYCMLLADFEAAIKNKSFVNNTIEGEFRFTKKGQAQGVKLIIEKTP